MKADPGPKTQKPIACPSPGQPGWGLKNQSLGLYIPGAKDVAWTASLDFLPSCWSNAGGVFFRFCFVSWRAAASGQGAKGL